MHVERIRSSKTHTLDGRTIVLGITGSIAAVKCVELARELVRRGARVHAVMTPEALRIIHPNAMEYATGNRTITSITGKIEHVEFFGIDGKADLLLVAPSTANTISKIALGIDDTPVTTMATTAIGSSTPVAIAPAMHESMYNHPKIMENLNNLKKMGIHIIPPVIHEGKAKMASPEIISLHVERILGDWSLKDKKVLITSGPSIESIDPIRVLTNRSSGIMGTEIALECWRRGAEVTVIQAFNGNYPFINYIRAEGIMDMLDAVMTEIEKGYDLFISTAAISDFIIEKAERKIKTNSELCLTLREAPKIIREVRKASNIQIIGFKAETGVKDDELIRIAREKMEEDGLQMVVANDVMERGMGTRDGRVVIVTEKGERWVEGDKSEIAGKIMEIYVREILG